eukprot:1185702-Prorocentrum_minimum.AAC.1
MPSGVFCRPSNPTSSGNCELHPDSAVCSSVAVGSRSAAGSDGGGKRKLLRSNAGPIELLVDSIDGLRAARLADEFDRQFFGADLIDGSRVRKLLSVSE